MLPWASPRHRALTRSFRWRCVGALAPPTLFGARLSPAPPVRSTHRSESSEACDPFAPGPFAAALEAEAPVASSQGPRTACVLWDAPPPCPKASRWRRGLPGHAVAGAPVTVGDETPCFHRCPRRGGSRAEAPFVGSPHPGSPGPSPDHEYRVASSRSLVRPLACASAVTCSTHGVVSRCLARQRPR